MTEWRQCGAFPDYEVSEYGTIRRLTDSACAKRGYVLRPKTDRYGYLSVRPFRNGSGRHVTVHRLVAIAFLGEQPPQRPHVAHIDGNHKNNHYSNLRWSTSKENAADKERHGRVPKGHRHWHTRLSDEQVAEIVRSYRTGLVYQRDLALRYGVNQAYVSVLCRGLGRGANVEAA